MRWILALLLVLNGVYYVWSHLFHVSVDGISVAKVKVGELRLRSELHPEELRSYPQFENDLLGEQGEVEGGLKRLCDVVGPFGELESITEVKERLSLFGVNPVMSEIDVLRGVRYQVYLPVVAGRAAAIKKLAEVQEKGLDSYLIGTGSLANHVSLGFFSRPDLVRDHLLRLKSMGYMAEVEEINDYAKEYWLLLNYSDSAKMNLALWESALKEIKNVKKQENFCLDVASDENIH